MPPTTPFLPLDPPIPYSRPAAENTHGGKTYKPTHQDYFRVEFSAVPGRAGEQTKWNGQAMEVGMHGHKDATIPSEESFSSRQLVAIRDFAPNSIIAPLTNLSLAPSKAYSSVQSGPGPRDHFELNSDLLFMNHSCDPSAYLDLLPNHPELWCLRTNRGIRAGEAITFFYPSTEWDMAQGFDCSCGSTNCLGRIRGARHTSMADMELRSIISEHIRAMKQQEVK